MIDPVIRWRSGGFHVLVGVLPPEDLKAHDVFDIRFREGYVPARASRTCGCICVSMSVSVSVCLCFCGLAVLYHCESGFLLALSPATGGVAALVFVFNCAPSCTPLRYTEFRYL